MGPKTRDPFDRMLLAQCHIEGLRPRHDGSRAQFLIRWLPNLSRHTSNHQRRAGASNAVGGATPRHTDRADHAALGLEMANHGTQYYAWLAIMGRAQWRTPADVKASYPKASILKGGRAVFNIKGNDYRLIASVQYQAGALATDSSGPTRSTTRSMRRQCDGCDAHPDR